MQIKDIIKNKKNFYITHIPHEIKIYNRIMKTLNNLHYFWEDKSSNENVFSFLPREFYLGCFSDKTILFDHSTIGISCNLFHYKEFLRIYEKENINMKKVIIKKTNKKDKIKKDLKITYEMIEQANACSEGRIKWVNNFGKETTYTEMLKRAETNEDKNFTLNNFKDDYDDLNLSDKEIPEILVKDCHKDKLYFAYDLINNIIAECYSTSKEGCNFIRYGVDNTSEKSMIYQAYSLYEAITLCIESGFEVYQFSSHKDAMNWVSSIKEEEE